MNERASAEPAIVCPFLAYGEERDFRASVPDHRHRCFADSPAAPRALAHQAAYCLTSAFAGCPTFLDWARREAAPSRDLVAPGRTLRDASAPRGGIAPDAGGEPRERAASYPAVPAAPSPRPSSTPSREADDWAAAPPWVASSGREASTLPEGAAAGAGGAAAAALAATLGGGAEPADEPYDEDDLGAPAAQDAFEEPGLPPFLAGRALDDGRPAGYQPVAGPATYRAPVGHAGLGAEQRTEHERAVDPSAPPWERPRRFEAYPTLRTRAGFRTRGRGVPRLAVWAGIIGVGVIVVFAAPFLLRGLGGGSPAGSPSPSPIASAAPSAGPSVTPEPVATPVVYTVKSGDTLSKIASKYKVTVAQILEANPKITNPNKIKPGDRITIPTPPPTEIVDGGGEITPAP